MCVIDFKGCDFTPDIFQLYTQMAANHIAAPLYSLYSLRVLWPALVLPRVFVLGAGPVWTSILCVGSACLRKLMGRGALRAPVGPIRSNQPSNRRVLLSKPH